MKFMAAAVGILLSCLAAERAVAIDATSIDVQHYRLDLRIDPETKSLRGSVEVQAQRLPGSSKPLALDLSTALTVDSVTLNGKPSRFTHENDRILLAADESRSEAESISIVVTYHGTPQGTSFVFTERNGQPAISNYGLPFTARQWWPSKDDPADKANSADILITVPRPLVAASNGKLVATKSQCGPHANLSLARRIPHLSRRRLGRHCRIHTIRGSLSGSERHGHAVAVLCLSRR